MVDLSNTERSNTEIPNTEAPNADMKAFWNGVGGERWVSFGDRLEASLQSFGQHTIDASGAAVDESVLEIGCGCGPNSIELAQRVGSNGRVLGVDISAPVLDQARINATASKLNNVSFECADAQTADLGAGQYDLVFSRFGVMFFDDPVTAFENIRGALKPAGRIAFASWAARTENAWVAEPLKVVSKHIDLPAPPPADAPGPFSLGDESRVRDILTKAGFRNITVSPFKVAMVLGEDITEAVDFLMQLAPSGGAITAADPDQQTRSAIAADLAALMESYQGEQGVTMDAVALIVTADKS